LHVNGQYLRGFSQMRRRRGHESWERGAPVLPLSGPEIAPVSLSFSEIWELPRISSQFFGYCGTRTYDNSIFGSSRHARSIKRNQARNRTFTGSRLVARRMENADETRDAARGAEGNPLRRDRGIRDRGIIRCDEFRDVNQRPCLRWFSCERADFHCSCFKCRGSFLLNTSISLSNGWSNFSTPSPSSCRATSSARMLAGKRCPW